MSISLQKGQKVSLSKESKGLSNVLVGLGWDAVEQRSGLFGLFKAADIDCDATAILLKNGKFVDKTDVVYFGNLVHKSGTVRHMGDNLTGEGEGDDEQILIELSSPRSCPSAIASTRSSFRRSALAIVRAICDTSSVCVSRFL